MESTSPTAAPAHERLRKVRLGDPELGRWRLARLLLANWPVVFFALVSRGRGIALSGYGIPTVFLAVSFLGARGLDHGWLSPEIWQAVAFGMVLTGSWGIFGMISSIFNMPVSEGILVRIEKLVHGIPSKKRDAELLCLGLADESARRGLREDADFFSAAASELAGLAAESDAQTAELDGTIARLRKHLAENRRIVRSECLLYHFTEALMLFAATVVAFALLTKALSHVQPDAFEPGGAMTFFNAFYYCVTTVTTTDFGDILPVSRFARVLSVWQQILGVAFVTIVIGAGAELFQRTAAAPRYREGQDRKVGEQIMRFAAELFRDYDRLSAPRREIDRILDAVENRATRSGLIFERVHERRRSPHREREHAPPEAG